MGRVGGPAALTAARTGRRFYASMPQSAIGHKWPLAFARLSIGCVSLGAVDADLG